MRTVVSFWLSIFVCAQMQAMEQQQPASASSEDQPVIVLAGGKQFDVETKVLEQLGTLASVHNMQRVQWTDGTQREIIRLNLLDVSTFSSILDSIRVSLAGTDYNQHVTSIFEILQTHRPTQEHVCSMMSALDFLQANVRPSFAAATVLHCLQAGFPIATSVSKSYNELPADLQKTIPRDAYKRLTDMLHHALTEPDFIMSNPPLLLPPFAREILKNKALRTRGEIERLLGEHTNWRFLTYLPGIFALKELDLSDRGLRSLPPEIGDLIALKKLLLSGNDISVLPQSIEGLRHLECLSLDQKPLAPGEWMRICFTFPGCTIY